MKKLYLAKSNKANPDDVMRVRQLFSRFEIEVVEFTGGTYSHKPLKECDYLLIIPNLKEVKKTNSETYISLGKGLHEQIKFFKSNGTDLFIIHDTSDSDINMSVIADIDYGDPDNYVEYSVACLDNKNYSLTEWLEHTFKVKLKIETGSSLGIDEKYFLLLTNK